MKTDYPELEKIKIKVTDDEELMTVAGVNYYVGITLVFPDGTEYYCLNAKIHRGSNIISKSKYRDIFYYMIKAIKKGEFNSFSYLEKFFPPETYAGFAGSDICAFK